MTCKADGCYTRRGSGKSTFRIPDPKQKPVLSEKWLINLQLENYVHSSNNFICEDHFEESCFEGNFMSRLLGNRQRQRLKADAVPTKFRRQTTQNENSRKRELSQDRHIATTEREPDTRMKGVLTELSENNAAIKKRRHILNTDDQVQHIVHKRPVMVDVGIQVSPSMKSIASTCNIITETTTDTTGQPRPNADPKELLADHVYSRTPIPVPSSELNTAFIQSPHKEPDTDVSTSSSSSAPSSHACSDSDVSYVPSDESVESDSSTTSNDNVTTDPKILAFVSCLLSLFARVSCTVCGETVVHDDTKVSYIGTALTAVFVCPNNHRTSWKSQPVVDNRPVGNLMIAAAIVISGETYGRISHLAEILSLKFIGKTQFYNLQKDIIIPAIDHYYKIQRDVILEELQGKQLTLGGDGRCDSPGYSAKYCTYSLMDTATGVIPEFSLIQVSETTSSNQMELLGFKRAMTEVEEAGLTVDVLVTDRHLQIRKAMANDHPDKQHQFDIWHLSKSVKKRLTSIKPRKHLHEIKPWIPSICNHLWWCSRNADGNADLLEESWKSLVFHITNRHEFPGRLVTKCAHQPLSPDENRRKKWLKPDSPAFKALEMVITDPKLLKDIRQCSLFCHTGSLETYHSMMLKYCPKRQEFDYPCMVARTQLAVIDNNINIGRQQKTTNQGNPCFAPHCPRSTGRWSVRKVFEAKSYQFKTAIIHIAVTNQYRRGHTAHQRRSLQLPKNIARTPAPLKEDLIDEHMCRFRLT